MNGHEDSRSFVAKYPFENLLYIPQLTVEGKSLGDLVRR